jgi:2-amino-4-hydroxy-6-hydroxymethyldihydropteridine diphosphokinase
MSQHPTQHTAYIALGGNLGDVLTTFTQALRAMPDEGLTVTRVSSAYRTHALMASPTDPPGPDYWNAMAEVTTSFAPLQVLGRLHVLEAKAGRVRRTRWDARSLDLDLCIFDTLVLHATDLVLPHAEILKRSFVLAPLAELAPSLIIPGTDLTAAAALATCVNAPQDILEVRKRWFDAASFVS